MFRQHGALLEQRRDQAVADAAVLVALADRVDVFGRRAEQVVDDDAAVRRDAALPRQLDVRLNADRHDDELRLERRAISEPDPVHALFAEEFLRFFPHRELQPLQLELLLQQMRSRRIKLAFHQLAEQMHDRDVHAELEQSFGRFKAEQSAADDRRLAVLAGRFEHRLAVGDVPEADDTLLVRARNGEHERLGAGCENQLVVGVIVPSAVVTVFAVVSIRVTVVPV